MTSDPTPDPENQASSPNLKAPSTTQPPTAYFTRRRISLDAYDVGKLSQKVEDVPNLPTQHAELDDFGLPAKKRRSGSTTDSRAGATNPESNQKSTASEDLQEAKISFTRRRNRSSRDASRDHSYERSGSISRGAVKSHGEPEVDGLNDHEQNANQRGRSRLSSERSRSTQRPNTARSKSIGDSRRDAQASPSRRSSIEPIRETDEKVAAEVPGDQARYRSGTLSKIVEGRPISTTGGISEWSHQALAPKKEHIVEDQEDVWQDMPAYGKFDLYDDDGRLIAKGADDSDEEEEKDEVRGGAGRGYTRVQIDDDAKSATSMDENTNYLFKEKAGTNVVDEDEEQRDPLTQMKATKDLLTEGQRIAYVGVTRLAMVEMLKQLEKTETQEMGKVAKKVLNTAVEAMKMWGQKMMVRLYAHMDIDSSGE